MKKLKWKTLVLALLLALLGTVSAGTLAYFTAEETAHNVITSGGVKIDLIETIDKPTEDGTPFEKVEGVMPGVDVPKIVFVKNTGAAKAWIRIKLTTTVTLSDDKTQLNKLPDGTAAVTYAIKNTDLWLDGKDGYYYYRDPVDAGELTKPIIESVKFAPAMGNEYQNCTATVDVSAQAVQVANNPLPESGIHAEISGWPKE